MRRRVGDGAGGKPIYAIVANGAASGKRLGLRAYCTWMTAFMPSARCGVQ